MPVTLAAAAVFGLILVALAVYVSRGRFKRCKVHGCQGNNELLIRIRTHANFIEYVPFPLIFMALLESSGANKTTLAFGALVFFTFRILHVFGMRQKYSAWLRQIGAAGTFMTLIFATVRALVIAAGAFAA
jgi:uncharacterized membrane protein YecN with MAPEG domain